MNKKMREILDAVRGILYGVLAELKEPSLTREEGGVLYQKAKKFFEHGKQETSSIDEKLLNVEDGQLLSKIRLCYTEIEKSYKELVQPKDESSSKPITIKKRRRTSAIGLLAFEADANAALQNQYKIIPHNPYAKRTVHVALLPFLNDRNDASQNETIFSSSQLHLFKRRRTSARQMRSLVKQDTKSILKPSSNVGTRSKSGSLPLVPKTTLFKVKEPKPKENKQLQRSKRLPLANLSLNGNTVASQQLTHPIGEMKAVSAASFLSPVLSEVKSASDESRVSPTNASVALLPFSLFLPESPKPSLPFKPVPKPAYLNPEYAATLTELAREKSDRAKTSHEQKQPAPNAQARRPKIISANINAKRTPVTNALDMLTAAAKQLVSGLPQPYL